MIDEPLEEVIDQPTLFDMEPAWREYWDDSMPEFEQANQQPKSTINVQFKTDADRRAFLTLLGEDPARQKSIWYPKVNYLKMSQATPPGIRVGVNRYPIYVISKGRWDSRQTSRALEKLGIDYKIVVEPQEHEQYVKHIAPEKILTLPFSNLGQGSIPARNWVWEHALGTGARRHWILDDNLEGFYRLNQNIKAKVIDHNPFTPAETLADRYENVALAGLQYEMFVPRRSPMPAFRLNTRIYSCILILNSLPHRWRGRYNEDTDLSIRVLKDKWCTILLNAYSCNKAPTMTMGGGNTDELYAGNGRLKMAESLVAQHPDIVRVTQKWGRPQHHVDYSVFRFNKLKLKEAPGGE